MAHVAVIVGISGSERYLARAPRGSETTWANKAKKFRSERAAEVAAKAHIEAFPAVIQRAMAFRVEPLQ